MAGSPFDSTLYRDLFGDPDVTTLFSDRAEIRALLLVEATLATAQASEGIIPSDAADAIAKAARAVDIDPATLAPKTGMNGTPVPGLVAAFRQAMNAPEHAQFVHWGATSQDIADTGLVLRLRQALRLYRSRIAEILAALAELASDHAETVMAGRTFGQNASPTSFGAIVAGWGQPLLRRAYALPDIEDDVLQVSLSGAAGTLSAMGPYGPKVRARMAAELGLIDPGGTWHSARDGIAGLGGWMTQTAGTLGKMGDDKFLLSQSGIEEIGFAGAGTSSTMPQKANPIAASKLAALARHCTALNTGLQGAVIHRQQRDGAALMGEWMSLPQMCLCLGTALLTTQKLLGDLQVNSDRMARNLDDGIGLIHAEGLTFALARKMSRPDAQAFIKTLCSEAIETGTTLGELVARDHGPEVLEELRADAALGQAPDEARGFAAAVQEFLADQPE
jgi:3-carboxy-cis,cis-muconate cycloisomerase